MGFKTVEQVNLTVGYIFRQLLTWLRLLLRLFLTVLVLDVADDWIKVTVHLIGDP
jgi:hypothetical protein